MFLISNVEDLLKLRPDSDSYVFWSNVANALEPCARHDYMERDAVVPPVIQEFLREGIESYQQSEGKKIVTNAGGWSPDYEPGVHVFWDQGRLWRMAGSEEELDWTVPPECEARELGDAFVYLKSPRHTECIEVTPGESPSIQELERRFWLYHFVREFECRWANSDVDSDED